MLVQTWTWRAHVAYWWRHSVSCTSRGRYTSAAWLPLVLDTLVALTLPGKTNSKIKSFFLFKVGLLITFWVNLNQYRNDGCSWDVECESRSESVCCCGTEHTTFDSLFAIPNCFCLCADESILICGKKHLVYARLCSPFIPVWWGIFQIFVTFQWRRWWARRTFFNRILLRCIYYGRVLNSHRPQILKSCT